MTEIKMKLGLKFRWWVKPCIFALVVTNRFLNRLAQNGVEVVPKEENTVKEKYLIHAMYNQGDGNIRGVLFINWSDGVETALDPNEWTWEDWDRWQKSQMNRKPIERVGRRLGEGLTQQEFEAWEIHDQMKREEKR